MFRPRAGVQPSEAPEQRHNGGGAVQGDDEDWPDASRSLNDRGLAPPEPMMRVLEVYNDRAPVFLSPELEERGVGIRTEQLTHGVRLVLRKGASAGWPEGPPRT